VNVTQSMRKAIAPGITLSKFAQRLQCLNTCGVLRTPEAVFPIGQGTPTWELSFSRSAETHSMTQYSIASDYLESRLEASGNQRDILPLRHALPHGLTPKLAVMALTEYPLASISRHRKELIEAHYDRPDEFFLTFLGEEYSLYTQAHFASPGDSLETASERKLVRIADEFAGIHAKRILDVGCGWGGVTRFLAADFDVTALTLGQGSYDYTNSRLREVGLSADVRLCDVVNFRSAKLYDGVVILGVLEHIPRYGQLFSRLADLTRAGAKIYIDCASSYSRLAINPFMRQKVWPGTHAFVNLPAMIRQAQRAGFHVVELVDETSSYASTMGVWAERFAASKKRIVELVGEGDYRAFEMYLFGGEESLLTRRLEAYHCVLEKSEFGEL
jgi:cyclopropane-fatty-acyl-phospholipid synthase